MLGFRRFLSAASGTPFIVFVQLFVRNIVAAIAEE